MYSTKQHVNRAIEDTKQLLLEAMIFAEISEKDLAAHLGLSPATISNHTNPQNPRQFPLALLTELPEAMRNFIIERINTINHAKPLSGLDGSLTDEKNFLSNLNGQLALMKENEPSKVKNVVAQMRLMLDRVEAEVK